jgi:CRISPR-associated endonuclease/helicase Cas3
VGTVDMIGSRLLFGGYGCGFKGRPLHAGFLGQGTLVVHDEAHLEPAFQDLLVAVRAEQERCTDFRCYKVMELTATSHSGVEAFALSEEDRSNSTVSARIGARKHLLLRAMKDEKKELVEAVAAAAKAHEGTDAAVLVFLRSVKDVEVVVKKLPHKRVEKLTGTLRGRERDRLATENRVFARFMPPGDRSDAVTPAEGTVYLVCTSAGEVGVNLSADHLVCDLTPFDSMAQRFGRVNRFGEQKDTRIDVFHPAAFKEEPDYEPRRLLTLELLGRLAGDASPAALGELPATERVAAFSPKPVTLATDGVLFDAWAMTSVCRALSGRGGLPARGRAVPAWPYGPRTAGDLRRVARGGGSPRGRGAVRRRSRGPAGRLPPEAARAVARPDRPRPQAPRADRGAGAEHAGVAGLPRRVRLDGRAERPP